ncbi:MAG: tripartite tricarboxylate transporter substrate binding protein [Betaproteobacteria bacterium]|nr:tripartite tricarboxylate transporter substrate binding protein [Betaproteobacteria bacterium]
MTVSHYLKIAIATAVMAAGTGSAQAQAWPAKPIKLIVGSVPGGGQDLFARVVGGIVQKALGQQIVVENRGGADGTLAVDQLVKSAPDGYTFVMTSNGATQFAPALYPNLTYDPGRDLAGVSMIFRAFFALSAGPKTEIKTIQEFVAAVKREPGKFAYASSGKGSPHFFAMEMFKDRAGLDITEVSYRSTAPAAIDVAAGAVPFGMLDVATVRPHLQSGKIRLLAITAKERSPYLPDVPTIRETVVPGFETEAWNAIMAPAGTPRDVLDRMSKEIAIALRSEEVAKRMAEVGFTPYITTPDETMAVIREGLKIYPAMIRKMGITGN